MSIDLPVGDRDIQAVYNYYCDLDGKYQEQYEEQICEKNIDVNVCIERYYQQLDINYMELCNAVDYICKFVHMHPCMRAHVNSMLTHCQMVKNNVEHMMSGEVDVDLEHAERNRVYIKIILLDLYNIFLPMEDWVYLRQLVLTFVQRVRVLEWLLMYRLDECISVNF